MTHGRPATKIGFRRDVRLFLSILVAFYCVMLLLLLFFLQDNVANTRELMVAREISDADAATNELRRDPIAGDIETRLIALRARYGFDRIEVVFPNRTAISVGADATGLEVIERRIENGTIRFAYDTSAIESIRRRFLLIAGVTALGTTAAALLLFLYLPHILRPIEEMLDHAREVNQSGGSGDEAAYLVETFRMTVATLKEQEAELKRLHALERTRADDLQTIVSTLTRSLSSGLIAFDAEHRIVDINAAGRDILDLGDLTGSGAPISELLAGTQFAAELDAAIRRREHLTRREIEMPREGLPAKMIGLATVPLVNADGKFLGTLALFTDLTDVRRLESRIRELQTLADLGGVSASIAHEFRNSLSTILGLLNLARRKDPAPEVRDKILAAESEAKQLSAAVTSLLQFAKPMKLDIELLQLRPLLDDVAENLAATEPALPIHVRGDAAIRGDAALLRRAFANVLLNARDALEPRTSAAEPRIDVIISGGSAPADEVIVEITDNGSGMDDEQMANAFLPFYTTKQNGTGIGLPLARKIVLLHGGTLTLARRAEGGTAVRIELGTAVPLAVATH
ncbi:MAG TPA: ATP-binding protein [Thermoanaerobaculia bacterium]|nr:ATP-binding protein [Thermoanaerobaculia bacterium]